LVQLILAIARRKDAEAKYFSGVIAGDAGAGHCAKAFTEGKFEENIFD
jgi:hypothetical protein